MRRWIVISGPNDCSTECARLDLSSLKRGQGKISGIRIGGICDRLKCKGSSMDLVKLSQA